MYDFLPRYSHYYYQPIIPRENVVASNFRRPISDKIPPFLALSNLAFFQSRSPTRIYAARPLNLQRFSALASRKTCWRVGRGGEKRGRKSKVQRICLRGRGWRGRIESRRLVTKATMGTESNRKLIMAVSSVSPN